MRPTPPARARSRSLLSRRTPPLALPVIAALLGSIAASGPGCETSCSCDEKGCDLPECAQTTTTSATTTTTGATTSSPGDCGDPCTITVLADGTFDPPEVVIHNGGLVIWELLAWTDSVIPADGSGGFPAICDAVMPYSEGDFAGPVHQAPSGVFSLGPDDRGLDVVPCASAIAACSAAGMTYDAAAFAGGECLCRGGEVGKTMEETWESESITGVFIRLDWNKVHLAPGTDPASFDFTVLDREIDAAVKHGKLYSLGIKAGREGTPDWLFTNGVAPVEVRYTENNVVCGEKFPLGSPSDASYKGHYFDMLRGVAAHIKSRADWFRALAYIKVSGVNLDTQENRLPNGCAVPPDCDVCNNQAWSDAGYRPSLLYQYYDEQTALLAAELPGKDMSYALIQAGFPIVMDNGTYETEVPNVLSDGQPVPMGYGTEQTEQVLIKGAAAHGLRFVVQHNGLGPTGAPNKWVVNAGEAGQITGFQTNNSEKVGDSLELNATFQNLVDSSGAVFVEVYEDRLWEGERQVDGYLDPAVKKTIADWAEELYVRRLADWPDLSDPFPMDHGHTFTLADPNVEETHYYIHGSKCASGGPEAWGKITVLP